MSSEPTLLELKEKLEEEDALYAELLGELDALAKIQAPYDQDASLPERLSGLNASPALTPAGAGSEGGGLLRRLVRRLVKPELDSLRASLLEQQSFNRELVQFLNRFAETTNRAVAIQAEFTSTLIRFAQRIDRLADAKDRLYASLGNHRTDLLLEAMDKRLEHVRLGLRRLTDTLRGVETSLTIARAELRGLSADVRGDAPAERAGSAPSPESFEEEHYLAFEERFRGSPEELRRRFRAYVSEFEGRHPVVDLGCGRGEFLELLRDAGIESRGVDGNREMVHACREKELDAVVSDLVTYLENQASGSLGGVFAAQVIEHLPPALLRKVLGHCYRVLGPGGVAVLETVNPKSVAAFVAFYRDPTHQKPVHPDTLDFLLRAVGFGDVTIRFQSPMSERAKLLEVPAGTPHGDRLNENFQKLNALLFGDQDYAAVATKPR